MDKITIKLIKYFMSIITLVIVVCFITTGIFFSRLYMAQQYNFLKSNSEEIYKGLKEGVLNFNTPVNVILIKGGKVYTLTRDHLNIVSFFRSVNLTTMVSKGTFKNFDGQEFLYYKSDTSLGTIVVFQSYHLSTSYIQTIYIILILVYIIALVLSVPLIYFVGKRFTKPILKLQKASKEIGQGNFKVDMVVKTGDEIEMLSQSLSDMAVSLEEKYTLQRDFIANVSHDFKTPLSIIRNYSEAIHDCIIDDTTKIDFSNEIIREVDRLNLLVMDLLELSKLQSMGANLHRDFFNIKEFLTDCSDAFTHIINSKDIEIDVSSEDVEINGDSNYLYRVLYNFIDNAVKFSFTGGKIQLRSLYEDNSLKVSIRDYGKGIDSEMINNIWNRYYKHSESGGMGLGLAICSEILKIHEFTYGITSTKESGTEFYFVVPEKYIRKTQVI